MQIHNNGAAAAGFEEGAQKLSHIPAQALMAYKQAGRMPEARRCFSRLLRFEEGPRNFPFRYFYDSLDAQRMGGYPWPRLRVLTWPDPHDMLPVGVGADLVAAHPQIASEASEATVAIATAGDAYPKIATKQQWTKLILYMAGSGWDEENCKLLPTVCKLLRGRLRTELQPARSWYGSRMFVAGDEAVIVFRVAGGGMAHLHQGQDARINVHMCLLNCEYSAVVAAGSLRNYVSTQAPPPTRFPGTP